MLQLGDELRGCKPIGSKSFSESLDEVKTVVIVVGMLASGFRSVCHSANTAYSIVGLDPTQTPSERTRARSACYENLIWFSNRKLNESSVELFRFGTNPSGATSLLSLRSPNALAWGSSH